VKEDTSKESEKKYFTETISVPNPNKISLLEIKKSEESEQINPFIYLNQFFVRRQQPK
jgi:hypothetical protein